MKLLFTILLAIFSLFYTSSMSPAKTAIHVQTILHEDGSRTESRRNLQTRVLEEFRYGTNKRLKNRKLFQLDEEGRALQGLVFDPKDKLIGRVEFHFDEFGRLVEERSVDTTGRPTERIVYRYDKSGKRLKPLAYNFAPAASSSGTSEKKLVELPSKKEARSALATPGINNMPKRAGDTYIEGRGVPKGMRKVPRISLRGLKKDRAKRSKERR